MSPEEVMKTRLQGSFRRPAKYVEIGKTTLQHNLAYILDVAWRTAFLLILVFIFTQLWQAVFANMPEGSVEGYDLRRMIWYFMTAEVLVLSTPILWRLIGEQVRSGDLAYALNKPYSYIGYHFASFMAEAFLRFCINLVIGAGFVWVYLGSPGFSPAQVAAFLIAVVGSFAINFLILAAIGLLAFWVEEPAPYHFVYQKVMFILGGMLLPVEVFPETLQRVAASLPMKSMIHGPASTLARFDPGQWTSLLFHQALWILVLFALVRTLYRSGVKRIHVNGG